MGEQTQQDVLISNNHHKIYKITFKQSAPLCLKVFTFNAQEAKFIVFYRNHFEGVKEWMKMRYSGKSLLQTLEKMEISCKQSKEMVMEGKVQKKVERISLQVQTIFLPFPTLFQYLEGQFNNGASLQPEKIDFYLYYTVELFEVIIRGGSIPNFFYTPRNIFFDRPHSPYGAQTGNFMANYTSTVGLDLLFLGEGISLPDLEEIFPLLPTNLKELMQNASTYQRELNRIIKMKGLAWSLLCFHMKEVPNILIRDQLKPQVRISLNEVFFLLQKHEKQPQKQSPMEQLLKYRQSQLQLMKKQTGIDYSNFFKSILVDNCKDVTWHSIYEDLFLKHLVAQNTKKYNVKMRNEVNKITGKDLSYTKETVSKMILKELWNQDKKKEEIKRFYEERCIRGGSMVYFLVRTNVNFHSMMSHLNVLEFIDHTCFCDDLVKVHLNFIESSINDLPDLKRYKIPYSGIPAPPNIRSEEASVYNSLTSPQQIVSGLYRQVARKERSPIKVQHHSITTMNQLQYSLFHVY